jgi:hypothetical protein
MKYFRIQLLTIMAKKLLFWVIITRVHGSNPTWSDILVTETKKNSRFYYDNNVCPLRLDWIARGCVPKQRSLCARRPKKLRARVRACQTRKQSSVERRSLDVLIICSEISLKQKNMLLWLYQLFLSEGHRKVWCQFHQHLMPSFFSSRSRKCKLTVILALLGSKSVNAMRKMLMKLTLGRS